jgi:hypothetical protein
MAGTSRRTPRSQALAAGLRKAREEAAGKPGVRELTSRLGWKHPTLQRFETAVRTPTEEQVIQILDELDVHELARDELLDLARGAEGSAWLAISIPEQQRQLAALLELEIAAKRIVSVSSLLVPGLLQTGNYARAIMVAAEVPRDQIETRVAVRLGRRDALVRSNPVHLRALVWEPVLRAGIGGPKVMAEQLRFLVKMADLDTVDLRIVPGDAGWHPGLVSPFVLIEDEDGTAVVHLETPASGLYLHEEQDVEPYQDGAEKVLRTAMSPDESIDIITREAERIEEAFAHDDGE